MASAPSSSKPADMLILSARCFRSPFAVQHESIPQAMLGMHVLCQAKSGMGKTAVFVLAVLQQMEPQSNPTGPGCLVLCHTRELAFQVSSRSITSSPRLGGLLWQLLVPLLLRVLLRCG
jgi:hypothetical protein